MSDRTKVIAWNTKVGRNPAAVTHAVHLLIRLHHPDVVQLLEARGYRHALRLAFGLRWRVICENSDIVALVHRRRIPRPETTVLRHDVPWIGPHEGLPHKGRRHLMLTFPTQTLILVHRVAGGPSGGRQTRGFNQPAWNADHELITEAAHDARDHGPVAILGDQNAEADDKADTAPARVARDLGGHLIRVPTKVDFGIQAGYDRATGRRLDNYGSDHPAVLYTLTR